MSIQFTEVTTPEQIQTVAALADEIWHQHYATILSPNQIDYMVALYQSPKALTEQLQSGYRYLLANVDGKDCGFCGFHREEENGKMFISKIYIEQEYRHRGIAKSFVQQVIDQSKGLKSVYLTVNKFNTGSIAAYQHLGFVTVDAIVSDIGNGYVMDDYVMEKTL